MTKMHQYVEDMRVRLTEVATTEDALIRALGEALSSVDQKLLADVQDLTLAHEARRVAILMELQNLASRIGAFPVPREPVATIEDATAAPYVASPEPHAPARSPGNWRQAVSNIKDELDVHFGRPTTAN